MEDYLLQGHWAGRRALVYLESDNKKKLRKMELSMISVTIIGISYRKRVVKHDGGYCKQLRVFSASRSIIRIYTTTNKYIFLLLNFSFTMAWGKIVYLRI